MGFNVVRLRFLSIAAAGVTSTRGGVPNVIDIDEKPFIMHHDSNSRLS